MCAVFFESVTQLVLLKEEGRSVRTSKLHMSRPRAFNPRLCWEGEGGLTMGRESTRCHEQLPESAAPMTYQKTCVFPNLV